MWAPSLGLRRRALPDARRQSRQLRCRTPASSFRCLWTSMAWLALAIACPYSALYQLLACLRGWAH
eukprot:4141437-Alexandrium_andersonii.AAC.1